MVSLNLATNGITSSLEAQGFLSTNMNCGERTSGLVVDRVINLISIFGMLDLPKHGCYACLSNIVISNSQGSSQLSTMRLAFPHWWYHSPTMTVPTLCGVTGKECGSFRFLFSKGRETGDSLVRLLNCNSLHSWYSFRNELCNQSYDTQTVVKTLTVLYAQVE